MVKNVDLFTMRGAINSIKSLGSNNFKLAIMINEDIITERTDMLETLVKATEKIDEYRNKYRELLMEHAEKENGEIVLYVNESCVGPKATNGSGFPNITNDISKFNEKKEKLNLEYKEEIDAHEVKINEFNKTLEEEAIISFVKFNADILPELDYNVIKAIKPLLNFKHE